MPGPNQPALTVVASLALAVLAAGLVSSANEATPRRSAEPTAVTWDPTSDAAAVATVTLDSRTGWQLDLAEDTVRVPADGFSLDRRARTIHLDAGHQPETPPEAFVVVEDPSDHELVLLDEARSFTMTLTPPTDGSANRSDALTSTAMVTFLTDPATLVAEHWDLRTVDGQDTFACGKGVTSSDGSSYAAFGLRPTASVAPGSAFDLVYQGQQDGCPDVHVSYAFLGLWTQPTG